MRLHDKYPEEGEKPERVDTEREMEAPAGMKKNEQGYYKFGDPRQYAQLSKEEREAWTRMMKGNHREMVDDLLSQSRGKGIGAG